MSILRRFRGQVAGTAGWSSAAILVSAVTGVITARTLGPEDRGALAIALTVGGLCVLMSALGTNVAFRRHLPKNTANRRGFWRLTALLVPATVVVLAGGFAAVSAMWGDRSEAWSIAVPFGAYGLALFVSNQFLDLLHALGLSSQASKVNALGSFACMLFVLGLAFLGLGLSSIIWAYAGSVVVQIAIATVIVSSRGLERETGPVGVRELIRDGPRLLGLNLGQALAFRSGTVVLGAISVPEQVGVYAVATTPAGILRIPSNALSQVMFFRAASGTTSASIARGLRRLFYIAVPLSAIGWLLAEPAILIVFGSDFDGAVWPFRVLLIAELALIPFLVLSRVLAGMGGTWSVSVCGLVGVAVLVIGCLVLVPGSGAVGAATASTIAYGVMSATSVFFYLRRLRQEDTDQ